MNQGKRQGGQFGSDNMHDVSIWQMRLNNFPLIFSATMEKTNANN
jgi:hypothetical protein